MFGLAVLIMAAWQSAIGRVIVCVIGALLALEFAVLQSWRWRAVPLQQRNITRATAGAFVLVVCAVLAVNGFPVIGPELTAGLALLALLYVVVGVVGSQGSRVDVMSVFWWGVLALGGGALLVLIEGFRP
jgi:hypothetical protein